MDELRVVAAAVWIHGTDLVVVTPQPGRHHTIINGFAKATGSRLNQRPEDQGFLLSDGTFATREEASALVDANGQERLRNYTTSKLFSEDLW